MVLEDVVAFKTIADIRVSPDGRTAVIEVRAASLEENRFATDLFMVDLAGEAAVRPLTFSKGPDAHPRWSPDGRRIGFLSDRGGTTQVWALPRDGGEALPLTAHAQPIADFEWAPDGRRLLVLSADPPSAEAEKRTKEKDDGYLLGEEWRNDRLFVTEVPAGSPTEALQAAGAPPAAGGLRPLTDGRRHVREGAVWSPDGGRIAFISTPSAEEDSWEEGKAQVVTVATGEVTDVRGGDRATAPAWSPDGRWLAFIRPYDGQGISRADLFLWPAVPEVCRAGDDAAWDATAPLDREAEEIRWSADSAAVDVFYSEGAVHAMARVQIVGASKPIEIGRAGAFVKGPPRVVWAPGHTINLPQRAGLGWVYVRGDRPAEVWKAVPPKAGRPLTVLNEAAGRLDLPVIETVRWPGPVGPIEGVLVRPSVLPASRRYPLILRPHGGPRSHSTVDFDPQAAWFAARGYLVLKPNFRGSTGYGDAFTRANVADWGDGPLGDVLSGADDLIARGHRRRGAPLLVRLELQWVSRELGDGAHRSPARGGERRGGGRSPHAVHPERRAALEVRLLRGKPVHGTPGDLREGVSDHPRRLGQGADAVHHRREGRAMPAAAEPDDAPRPRRPGSRHGASDLSARGARVFGAAAHPRSPAPGRGVVREARSGARGLIPGAGERILAA
jgi:dipeptidyl aminopeptidase/acylaminoacyl peptidase